MRTPKLLLLALLLLAGLSAAGCRTMTGAEWFADRARDLADTVRVQVGVGPGIGVNLRAGGVLQGGLCVATVPHAGGIGWDYGRPWGLAGDTHDAWDGEVSASACAPFLAFVLPAAALGKARDPADRANPLNWPPAGKNALFGYWRIEGADGPTVRWSRATRTGYVVADGFWGRVRPPGAPISHRSAALWREEARAFNPRAHWHAFDVEASVYAGLVYAKVGVSPGEMLDFALGCFGLDIAGDDGR